MLSVHSEH